MTEHGYKPLLASAGDSGRVGASHSETGSGEGTGNGGHGEQATGSILSALESVLVDFERLMADRSREDLQKPAQDGGWGVVEILAHLLDWEEITHDRVWRILDEDRPELEEYDDSLWAIEHEYGSKDPHQVFRRITELRNQLVERLRELDDAGWQRTGILAERGEFTLQALMTTLVRHDAKHLAQARDVIG
jgi:hypothetical protein